MGGHAEQLTAVAVANYAYHAGFRGDGLVMAVAIAGGESGFITDQRGDNRDSQGNILSTDWGLWQINDYWHGEVTLACALDPACAAGEVFRISQQGSNWTPWVAYLNGRYLQFMAEARVAVQAIFAQHQVQAQIDIDQFVDNDLRFQSLASELGVNLDWDPAWELRYQTYQFSWLWQTTIYHATNKADPSIRLINFVDPSTGAWNGWYQI